MSPGFIVNIREAVKYYLADFFVKGEGAKAESRDTVSLLLS